MVPSCRVLWSSGLYLAIDPVSGTDAAGALVTRGYNDFAHLRWLGVASTPRRLERAFDNLVI